MNLELFEKTINAIQEHRKWQDEVTDFLEAKICTDTWAFCTVGENLISLLVEILEKEFNDIGKWIDWWLFEDVEKVVYYQDKQNRNVEKIEDFYQFLLDNKKENQKVNVDMQKAEENLKTLEEILEM